MRRSNDGKEEHSSNQPPAPVSQEGGTRRAFLRDSATAILASHPVLAVLTDHADAVTQPSPLKTEAQYRSEAAQFDAAIRDLTAIPAIPVATDADITRITSAIERAARGLDFLDSWMVMICFSDPALVAWVRKEIRDEATFNKFIDSVKANPKAVDAIPGVAQLHTRLAQLQAEKAAIVSKVIAKSKAIGGLETSGAEAAKRAQQAQACQRTWSMVAAIIALVVVIVIAVVVSVFTAGAASTAAASLVATYKGQGAELARSLFATANQRYAQCVANVALLPTSARAKALAACQAAWLADKAVLLG